VLCPVAYAYHIPAATRTNLLKAGKADLWDSGRIESEQMSHVPYAGKPLGPNQTCWWTVRVWGEENRASAWGKPAMWTMELSDPGAWHAKWIGAACKDPALPIFRTEFTLAKPVKRALDPGWTNHRKRCLCTFWEVTEQLQPGPNALAVMLGNGMYNVVGSQRCEIRQDRGRPSRLRGRLRPLRVHDQRLSAVKWNGCKTGGEKRVHLRLRLLRRIR